MIGIIIPREQEGIWIATAILVIMQILITVKGERHAIYLLRVRISKNEFFLLRIAFTDM